MFDLTGRVAIVTGGNGGIGFGIARGLSEAGASLVLVGRNAEKTAWAVSEIEAVGGRAIGLSGDVQDAASVRRMVREALDAFGRIDILVNNAGIGVGNRPEDISPDEWASVLNSNLTSVFLCSREVYSSMAKAKRGKIINIGSILSIFGHPKLAHYAASKGGVVQLTKSLAIAWAKDGIQVNAILPGWIRTDMTAWSQEKTARSNALEDRTPMGRWGLPSDLAGTAVYLASSASDFVTGACIPVDGGYSSHSL
jgi:2-deoxy-D-gluconate 3-dehydrogenase